MPTIQLSKATVAAIVLGILAGITFGVGVARLDGWDAAAMTSAEGQRALANFIATATLAAVFAIVAAVVWGASAIITRLAADGLERVRSEAAFRILFADLAVQVGEVFDETRTIREQGEARTVEMRGIESRVAKLVETAIGKLGELVKTVDLHGKGMATMHDDLDKLTERVDAVGSGAVGKAVAGDIGALRAEIHVLRRDHDELSEEVGRSKVARLRSAAPPDGR